MTRVTRSVARNARKKKVLAAARGYRERNRTTYRNALRRVRKGLQYAYRDRRNRKRDFRRLWIQRINAAAREHGLTYGRLLHGLKAAGVDLDRKVLADLTVRDPESFRSLVAAAQAALARPA